MHLKKNCYPSFSAIIIFTQYCRVYLGEDNYRKIKETIFDKVIDNLEVKENIKIIIENIYLLLY